MWRFTNTTTNLCLLQLLIRLGWKDRFVCNVRYAYKAVLLSLLNFSVSSIVHYATTHYKACIVELIMHARLMLFKGIVV